MRLSVCMCVCRTECERETEKQTLLMTDTAGLSWFCFSIFVTNSSKSTFPKKSKQCDRQKGKAVHVSQSSFS